VDAVVVKLGGSVITDKSSPFKYRGEVVTSLARAMVSSSQKMVLVHGGGSFGHPVATTYGLSSSPSRATPDGVSRTREAMFKLNRLVCQSLSSVGLYAYTFSPFTLVQKAGMSASSWIKKIIDAGLTPVTFGDIVIEGDGFKVLSGDTISYELCRILKAKRCVFVLDVDGVYNNYGRLIREITRSSLNLKFKRADDATGGMRLKLIEALKIASLGTQVALVSGFKIHEFSKALQGREFHGTIVRNSAQ
jgi:isopentenyl phosphate kinase